MSEISCRFLHSSSRYRALRARELSVHIPGLYDHQPFPLTSTLASIDGKCVELPPVPQVFITPFIDNLDRPIRESGLAVLTLSKRALGSYWILKLSPACVSSKKEPRLRRMALNGNRRSTTSFPTGQTASPARRPGNWTSLEVRSR